MKTSLALVLAGALAAGPATAQVVVHDPVNYGSLIEQAQTALNQLNELKSQVGETKRLYDGFNTASGVNGLAPGLAIPQLRAFVPDIDAYLAAAKGDLGALGDIGHKARDIRQDQRLYTAPTNDLLGRDLERAGDRAARDLALGQQTVRAGAERLAGLQQLTAALDTAPNARALMDLQARLAAEQAMTANDQMRLQGLAMAQAAEDRLQAQRDRERAAADRQARMALYRRAFQ
jgi:type IV secretion system protein VirB5